MRSMLEYAIEVAGASGAGQDRAAVFTRGDQLLIVLADGAGGSGKGALAAETIVAAVGAADHEDWSSLLLELEPGLGGESTAVIVKFRGDRVTGVSVGDSGAWWIDAAGILDLTEKQIRKPLVGGECSPFAFRVRGLERGTLLVASDGLFNYAKPDDIARVALGPDLPAAALALIDLVRLPTGALQDDVSVVLCR
jgi:PPM family protein phosphatase